MKFCELKKVEHIEVSSLLNINVTECFNMLIQSIIKDKTKEELIDRYGKIYKDENCEIENEKKKKKKIFSKFDKCICFWNKYNILLLEIINFAYYLDEFINLLK